MTEKNFVIPDGVQVITMPRLSDTMTDGCAMVKESWR